MQTCLRSMRCRTIASALMLQVLHAFTSCCMQLNPLCSLVCRPSATLNCRLSGDFSSAKLSILVAQLHGRFSTWGSGLRNGLQRLVCVTRRHGTRAVRLPSLASTPPTRLAKCRGALRSTSDSETSRLDIKSESWCHLAGSRPCCHLASAAAPSFRAPPCLHCLSCAHVTVASLESSGPHSCLHVTPWGPVPALRPLLGSLAQSVVSHRWTPR
jgi:hypothetical protein